MLVTKIEEVEEPSPKMRVCGSCKSRSCFHYSEHMSLCIVSLAYRRKTDQPVGRKITEACDRTPVDAEITVNGTLAGFHIISSDFEFQPDVGRLIHVGLNEQINDDMIAKLTQQFFHRRSIAKMYHDHGVIAHWQQKLPCELVALKPLGEE